MTVNSLGNHFEQDRTTRTAAEWLWALLPIGLSVFCLSALVYYHVNHDEVRVGSTMQVAIAGLYRSLGFAPACMFFLLLLTWSSIWFVTGDIERPVARLARLAAMTLMLGVFMNLGDGGVTPAFNKGELGAWLAGRLVGAFGYYPSLVLVWAATLGTILLATDYFFHDRFERLRAAKSPAEVGVEVEATDHLLGLQTVVAPSGDALPAAVEAPPAVVESAIEPPDVDRLHVEPPPAERPRRRSYFERRHEVAAEVPPAAETPVVPPVAAEAADEWVPTGPDAQEIDDVELGEPMATASGAAGADPGEEFVVLGESSHQLAGEGAWEPVGAPEEPPQFEPLAGEVATVRDQAPESEPDAAAAVEVATPKDSVDGASGADPAAVEPMDAQEPMEPVVAIPRPDPVVPPVSESEQVAESDGGREPVRQQRLFGASIDEALVAEAAEIVTAWRRASATFLQRKLRVDYEMACQLLVELAARGVVELEGDASRARVLR
jgi:hypothetical protein